MIQSWDEALRYAGFDTVRETRFCSCGRKFEQTRGRRNPAAIHCPKCRRKLLDVGTCAPSVEVKKAV